LTGVVTSTATPAPDANSNGISEAGELQTFAQAGLSWSTNAMLLRNRTLRWRAGQKIATELIAACAMDTGASA
jgi:hypothetical protein